MENNAVISIEQVIDYIENHLSEKIDLETVSTTVNYSKYHLHRMFTETVGLTIMCNEGNSRKRQSYWCFQINQSLKLLLSVDMKVNNLLLLLLQLCIRPHLHSIVINKSFIHCCCRLLYIIKR